MAAAHLIGIVSNMNPKHLKVDIEPKMSVRIAWGFNIQREARRILAIGNCVYVIGHFTPQGEIEADKIRIIYADGAVNDNTGYLIEGGKIIAPQPFDEIEF